MFKVDLHTHSILSHDGGITESQYRQLIRTKTLNCVAITDHNEIDFALKMYKKLGESVIVGEEVSTKEGHIIGLFLKKKISPNQSFIETIKQIRAQKGIVYIPHPLEERRKGLTYESILKVQTKIDIIETFNARTIVQKNLDAVNKIIKNQPIATSSSSDAHGLSGIGTAYNRVETAPTKTNLLKILATNQPQKMKAPWISFLQPKINTLRKKLYEI